MLSWLFVLGLRLFTGAQATWSGCPPVAGQRVYFANHTSNLDFLAIWSVLPDALRRTTRPVAAHDYWTAGRIRMFLAEKIFNALLIERKKVTKSNNPLHTMIAAIKDGGDSLIIFPEGGRSMTEEMMPFKSGLFHLARQCDNVEFVPVYIDNLNRVLPKGEVLPLPLICSVIFGAPIRLEAGESKDDFLQRAEAAVKELITL